MSNDCLCKVSIITDTKETYNVIIWNIWKQIMSDFEGYLVMKRVVKPHNNFAINWTSYCHTVMEIST